MAQAVCLCYAFVVLSYLDEEFALRVTVTRAIDDLVVAKWSTVPDFLAQTQLETWPARYPSKTSFTTLMNVAGLLQRQSK